MIAIFPLPTWAWKILIAIISILFAAIFLIYPWIPDDPIANRCSVIFSIVISFWTFNVMPPFATAMLVIPLSVIFRVLKMDSMKESLNAIVHGAMLPIVLILLGSFAIAKAFEQYRICHRMGNKLFYDFCNWNASVVTITVMSLCLLACSLMPNQASSILILSLISDILIARYPADDNRVKGLLIALMVTGNIGGMISPISSPQNAYAFHLIYDGKLGIQWIEWMGVGIPVSLVATCFSWVVISLYYNLFNQEFIHYHMKRHKNSMANTNTTDSDASENNKIVWIVLISLITIFGWIGEPYFEDYFGNLAIISLIPIALLFVNDKILMGKRDFAALPWDIMLQALGAGALNYAIKSSGLVTEIAKHATLFNFLPYFYLELFCITVVILFSSNLKSHFLSGLIFSPIMMAISETKQASEGKVAFLLTALTYSTGMTFQMSSMINAHISECKDKNGDRYLSHQEIFLIGSICSLITFASIMTVGYPLCFSIFK